MYTYPGMCNVRYVFVRFLLSCLAVFLMCFKAQIMMYTLHWNVYIYICITHKIPLRDVCNVKSRGRRMAKREPQVTHVTCYS